MYREAKNKYTQLKAMLLDFYPCFTATIFFKTSTTEFRFSPLELCIPFQFVYEFQNDEMKARVFLKKSNHKQKGNI